MIGRRGQRGGMFRAAASVARGATRRGAFWVKGATVGLADVGWVSRRGVGAGCAAGGLPGQLIVGGIVGRTGTSAGRRGGKSGAGGHSRRTLAPSRASHSAGRRDPGQSSHKSLLVVGSLVGVLSLTSVLLRAMQGAPLTPDAAYGLVSAQSRASLGAIFNTRVGAHPNRWRAIYIHHSKTASGSAATVSPVDGGCG